MSIKKHSLYLGFTNVVTLGINFVGGIFLTRLLGPEGRGVLTKLEAGAGLLAQITTFKSHMGFVYFVANEKVDRRKLLGIGILIIAASLLLSCIILIGLTYSGYETLLLPIGYTNSFFAFYSLVIFILTESQIIFSAFLRGAKSFRDIYVNQIVVSCFRLLLFVSVFYWLGKTTIELHLGIALQVTVLGMSLLTTLYFFKNTLGVKPDFRIDISNDLKPFFSFVSVSYLSLFTNFLMKSVSIWIVEYFQGSVELGYYAVGVNLSMLLMVLPSTIREVFIPYIASSDREENLKNLTFFSRVGFTLILLIATVIFLLSDHLIPFLYGAEFTSSIVPFKYLLAAIAMTSIGIIFSAYNYGTGSPKLNFYANVVSLVMILVLDFWLIPKYGITGAAIATLITYTFNSALIFFTVIFNQKLPIKNYFFVSWEDIKKLRKFKRGNT